jgi:putative oxidoreductase
MSYGLLLLRVVVGATMFGHGAQKLFGWFGGPGPEGTKGMLGHLGFPAAKPLALLVGLSEAAGVLLALGLVTPLACLALAVVMLVAIATVHWSKGFWNTAGGYEFPLVILTVAIAIAATGPGRFSLDNAIGWADNISGLWWAVGVLGAAILIAGLTVTVGRRLHAFRQLHPA